MPRNRPGWPVSAVLVLAVMLGGCGLRDKANPTSSSTAAPFTTQASPGVTRPPPSTPKSSGNAGGTPIATAGDPASPDGGIEILSLKRDSAQLVTLRLVLVNSGTKDVTTANRFSGSTGRSLTGLYLIDPGGLKKYLTVLDAKESCVCSDNLSNVQPGGRLDLFATFAAPPPEVATVTVVIPSFQPISGVPVS